MYIIGIDEVGRGSLAGPVMVAAVALSVKKRFKNLRDSKKLSPKAREQWFRVIKSEKEIFYAVCRVTPKKIDEINISASANLAATRAFIKLIKNSKFKTENYKIFLDAGLSLSKSLNLKFHIPNSIIKGDEKINAIKLASIVAKVTRDKYMVKLHKLYPKYGFNIHKGYGTKRHLRAIKKYGISNVHRCTFKIH